MFFDDINLLPKRKARLQALPPIPDTNWKPPSYYPNLSNASVISYDVETKELDWEHGPGWARGPKGHIVGFSVAAISRGNVERGKWYFPIRHEVETEYNLDERQALGWLKQTLETPNIPKVGTNLIFDTGWLTEENIFVEGQLFDIQFAEALLDEDAKTSLDFLGFKYCGEGKANSFLYDWIRKAYHPKERELRGEIYRSPPRLVGPYGEQDADLPIRIMERQWPLLAEQNLIPLFHLECGLIRLMVRMRRAGVRIDLNYVEKLYAKFATQIEGLHEKIRSETGFNVNLNSSRELGPLFDSLGIKYPTTEAGNPSFQKEYMTNLHHPVVDDVVKARYLMKMNSTFLKGYLLEGNYKGKVYTEFHPLRVDAGEGQEGAKTGRYSSSDPNLQNIPVRTEEGKLIRAAFVPDEGMLCWEKDDMSQMEYRYLAHNAVDAGDGSAERLRQEYRDNPNTDYHEKVYKAAVPYLGWERDTPEQAKVHRRPIKNTNFGLIYGQGFNLLAYKLGLKRSAAKDFFEGYHKAAPWVKPTMAAIAEEVHTFGYITTILGRRCRFNLWEPVFHAPGQARPFPLPYEQALRAYGTAIKRSEDYKGVNYKFQGSNADHIKKWMLDTYNAGVFDVIGVPRITVHDELDFNVIDDSPQQREGYEEMRRIFERAIPLSVPVKVDFKRGANWAVAD